MGLTIIYAILIFGLLIFTHELGHFVTAKAVGIRVNEFSIGMGPAIFQRRRGETDYSLRLLPIGGYVRMEGEDEDSKDANAFHNKPFWAKALVIVAGAFMNLVTAVIILSIVVANLGVYTTTIASIDTKLPAAESGIMAGDRLLKVDDVTIKEWGDLSATLQKSADDLAVLTVERDGKELTFTSNIAQDEAGRKMIGVTCELDKSIGTAVKTGITGCVSMTKQMGEYFVQLFTGKSSVDDLVGPVGIVTIINEQAQKGWLYVANFAALISLNLAFVNMLPLPALDGGRFLMLIIRKFTGKAVSDEVEGKIHFAGMMLLFALMIYIVIKDVNRFIM